MGGILSDVLAVVGIAAAVATGGTLGLVAGALMAGEFAASQGWLGGSAQKFMSSGVGEGLMAATALGSGALAAYGMSAGTAGAVGLNSDQVADLNSNVDTISANAASAN